MTAADVVPVASKYTYSGATPVVRLIYQRGEFKPTGLQLDDPGDRVSRFVNRSQHLTSRTHERFPGRG